MGFEEAYHESDHKELLLENTMEDVGWRVKVNLQG
jgi:hypothetical protein